MKNKISEMVYQLNDIKEEVIDSNIYYVNPIDLLSVNRLDIIGKYLYLELKDKCPIYAKKFYREHIRAMTKGSFIEPYSDKTNLEAFITSFDNLLKSVKESGFDETKGIIPVDSKMNILDGAHRVAIGIHLGIAVPIIKINIEGKNDIYDQAYFGEQGVSNEYIDLMMLNYLKLTKENILCLNIWPSAIGHDNEVRDILDKHFKIIYDKKIILNENGAFYYLYQIYKEYTWAQDNKDGYSGVYRKLIPCFRTFSAIKTFLLIPISNTDIVEIKSKLRNLYDLGKHSLHMTDNTQETIQMCNIILSDDTIKFLNVCKAAKFKSTMNLIDKAIEIKKINDRVCFTGSLVLALHGIREANDVDYICSNNDKDSHNSLIDYYELSVEEILYRPDLHISFMGLDYLKLNQVKQFKLNRREGKDLDDINLINKYETKGDGSFCVSFLRLKRRIIANIQGVFIRIAYATKTYSLARSIHKKIKNNRSKRGKLL